jgi:hypothetical protein
MTDDVAFYERRLRPHISQGDIFADLRFAWLNLAGEEPSILLEQHPGVLLTYDCEYDKPHARFVLAARVRLLSDFVAGEHGNIKRGRVRRLFHLPPSMPNSPEAVVDFE